MATGGKGEHEPQKVLIIGDSAVGKSSLIARYVAKKFEANYLTTLGVDFALKTLTAADGQPIRLHLWDIAGQERFGQLLRVYYKNANACMVVCDVTRKQTLDNVSQWKRELDDKVTHPDGGPLPAILLVNKCDMKEARKVSTEDIERVAKEYGFLAWREVSAKADTGINAAFDLLVQEILRRTAAGISPSPRALDDNINIKSKAQSSDDSCAC